MFNRKKHFWLKLIEISHAVFFFFKLNFEKWNMQNRRVQIKRQKNNDIFTTFGQTVS